MSGTANEDFAPSEWPTIVFIVLFLIAILAIITQFIRHRKETVSPVWSMALLLSTPILELVGFGVRLSSALNPTNSALYMANMIILNVGLPFLTMANWWVFAALIVFAGMRYSKVMPRCIAISGIILTVQCIQLQTRGNGFDSYID